MPLRWEILMRGVLPTASLTLSRGGPYPLPRPLLLWLWLLPWLWLLLLGDDDDDDDILIEEYLPLKYWVEQRYLYYHSGYYK